MSDFWEEWRRRLAEDNPDVKPEYTNRLGIWHHDFRRERPTHLDNGELSYPSRDYIGAGIFEGGISKAGLFSRGWTRTAINRILGTPDYRLRNAYGTHRAMAMYRLDRVKAAEDQGPIRYRNARRDKEPDADEIPLYASGLPFEWLPKLRRFHFWAVGVREPWFVDRLIYGATEGLLCIQVNHARVRWWHCPKCGRKGGLYDHKPESIWRRGKLTLDDGEIPFVIRGRLPRVACPKHGPRCVAPLHDFDDASGNTDPHGRVGWVINSSLK